jgi:hypothetical protein
MVKKTSRRKQKVYKMKGCSKKNRKNYLGGSADVNLAYTGNGGITTVPNPFLAYTGKGGNTDAMNKTVPNTGPPSGGFNFLNPIGPQHGGCGCGMVGGKKNHRVGCKCSSCRKKMIGGNPGIPYPDGLVGSPWNPTNNGLPGVDGIQGGRNYLPYNNYPTDISRQMIATGANPPFSIGGKRRAKKQCGGTLSNFIGQDLINLGRQFQFGVGSAYNALAGYSSPVNPMPWKGQMPDTPSISTMRAAYI